VEITKILTLIRVLGELRQLRSHDKWNADKSLPDIKKNPSQTSEIAYKHSPFCKEFHKGLETQ
jgi:hypothetical protein